MTGTAQFESSPDRPPRPVPRSRPGCDTVNAPSPGRPLRRERRSRPERHGVLRSDADGASRRRRHAHARLLRIFFFFPMMRGASNLPLTSRRSSTTTTRWGSVTAASTRRCSTTPWSACTAVQAPGWRVLIRAFDLSVNVPATGTIATGGHPPEGTVVAPRPRVRLWLSRSDAAGRSTDRDRSCLITRP